MSLLHEANRFVGAVVRHIWRLMENSADTVASVGAHNAVTVRLYRVGNDVANLSVHLVRRAVFDGVHKTLVGLLDECAA